jgi:hypothetical protein
VSLSTTGSHARHVPSPKATRWDEIGSLALPKRASEHCGVICHPRVPKGIVRLGMGYYTMSALWTAARTSAPNGLPDGSALACSPSRKPGDFTKSWHRHAQLPAWDIRPSASDPRILLVT